MFRPEYDEDLFYHWKEIPVRFRDLDPLNHVNNALFNTYLEEARISFLGKVGKMQSEFTDGKTFVLVKSTIEYLNQITFPSSVLVGTGVGKIGNSSINAIQAIYNSKTKDLLCVAETKDVWFDITNQTLSNDHSLIRYHFLVLNISNRNVCNIGL
jgi:acyl-CoA thioester hydrolase